MRFCIRRTFVWNALLAFASVRVPFPLREALKYEWGRERRGYNHACSRSFSPSILSRFWTQLQFSGKQCAGRHYLQILEDVPNHLPREASRATRFSLLNHDFVLMREGSATPPRNAYADSNKTHRT